jgi:formate hydrogenlyase transcriptional activator
VKKEEIPNIAEGIYPQYPPTNGASDTGSRFDWESASGLIKWRHVAEIVKHQNGQRNGQHEWLFQTVFNSLQSPIVILDCNGVIIYANKSYEKIFLANDVVSTQVATSANYLDLFRLAANEHDLAAEKALAGIQDVLAKKLSDLSFEYFFSTREGRRCYLIKVDPLLQEVGGVVITHIDLEDQKRDDEMLKDFEVKFRFNEEALKRALLEVERLKDQLQAENLYLREEVRLAREFGQIIGESEPFKLALSQAEQVAPTDATVLITGETGTGKELLAHAIHNLSARKERSLVMVDCATLPASLIESELFGHEKGAFTGATTARSGRFELANRATIFLDEIGELPLELQTKLLRVLQEGEFERLGSSRTIKVDVRVIAATNRDLEEAVKRGSFRADLYYRLNVFPIRMPSLRERREDIERLAKFFVQQINQKLGKRVMVIPEEVLEAMEQYAWPGNVRELKNVIERAVILSRGGKLRLPESLMLNRAADLVTEAEGEGFASTEVEVRRARLDDVEREHILRVLEQIYWRIEGPHGAAAILGINPGTLRSRMKKLGIHRPRIRDTSGNTISGA